MPDLTRADDTVAFAGSVLTAAVPADQQSATTVVPHAERQAGWLSRGSRLRNSIAR